MKKPLLFIGTCIFAVALFLLSCSKNSNPSPPIHDTVTVIQKDTLTDTLYATKPDPTVNLSKGLLLYLPFSGNMADSSGNGNLVSVLNGASLAPDEHGYANNAFGGNGAGQALIVTNNGSINFDTTYSVCLDFMTADTSSLHCYISMVNNSNGYGPSFAMGGTVPGYTGRFDVAANDSTEDCDTYSSTDPNKLNDTTSFSPQLSRWYNAILTYHRGSISVYINGKLISTKTGTGSWAALCPSASVVIGGWWGGSETINGAVDNVRLYNRVLTPHEIVALSANYQVTSNSQKPGLQTRR